MTQFDPQADINEIDWSHVSLEPDPTLVAEIDQALPDAWLLPLESPEAEFDQEVLEPLYGMDNAQLNARVREVLRELDVDTRVIIDELSLENEMPQHEIDFDDFGR